MNGTLKFLGAFASLALVMVGGRGVAAAQDAVLYELVENVDLPQLLATGVRVSHWTAQGTARAGSPFCPRETLAALAPTATSCSVTAFGMDSIDSTTLTGSVWANIASVVNCDNVVDAPECVVLTGQVVGVVSLLPFTGAPVIPEIGKKRVLLGPTVPLIYVAGTFAPDDEVTLREAPPETPPADGPIRLSATFRLPFQIETNGQTPVEPNKRAFYLADDGDLIKVAKNELALGRPTVRAEVTFE